MQAYNDTGVSSYAGPCPPPADGPHRYVFTLYALPVVSLATEAGLSSTSTGALLGFNTRALATARATFTATYDR